MVFLSTIFIFLFGLLFGSAILYGVIKLFKHEIQFKTVVVITLITAAAGSLLAPLGLIGSILNFILLGLLLKKWSTIDSWGTIILIALTTGILTWVLILTVVMGVLLPLMA